MNTSGANRQAARQTARAAVERWLTDCVLGLSLCPYARAPYKTGRVKLTVLDGDDLLSPALATEARYLQQHSKEIETSLLILLNGFADFLDFNDRMGELEEQLLRDGFAHEFQLVSFHPNYRFAGEASDDAGHYTNRAPYPIVQLLRADSVDKAVEEGDTLAIPERNIKTLKALSTEQLRALFPWVN